LQGTESYTRLLQALGQTHPWSNSTDANGGSSIANLKRSKVTSQAGGRGEIISKIKRLKKRQKEKGGFEVDLPSGLWVLRVTRLWVFAIASRETQVWLHTKAEMPPQHTPSGAGLSRKTEITVRLGVKLEALATPS